MRILLTGGTGFIGTALTEALLARGDSVIVLRHRRAAQVEGVEEVDRLEEIEGSVDAVINLAGEPIADARWSQSRKQLLMHSRVATTEALVAWISAQTVKPQVLLSGSAIGFYGAATRIEEVTESDEAVIDDFSHQLCQKWEQAAMLAQSQGVRVSLLRTGVVLGQGGALAKMRLPFLLGVGGAIGSGEQWTSWIHIDDWIGAALFLLDNPGLNGPFNLTAPAPVSNRVFAKVYANSLGRPALIPMPAFVLKCLLGTEASRLLTEGLAVTPERLSSAGFRFRYTEIDAALADIARG